MAIKAPESAQVPHRALQIFVSYAREDEEHRTRLEAHLAPLQRQGIVATWHDRMVLPGMDRSAAINKNISSADLILLLVSADFVASEYCYEREFAHAVARHERGESRVVAVIVRPVDIFRTPLAAIQTLPSDGRPVSSWSNSDEAWLDVAIGVRRLAESLRGAQDDECRGGAPVSPKSTTNTPAKIVAHGSVPRAPARLQRALIKVLVGLAVLLVASASATFAYRHFWTSVFVRSNADAAAIAVFSNGDSQQIGIIPANSMTKLSVPRRTRMLIFRGANQDVTADPVSALDGNRPLEIHFLDITVERLQMEEPGREDLRSGGGQ